MEPHAEQRFGSTPPGQPDILTRLVWFVCLGWWLGAFVCALIWLLTVSGIWARVGVEVARALPKVISLSPIDQNERQPRSLGLPRSPLPVRAAYFLLIGWWLSVIWLVVAYLAMLTHLMNGLALWMFTKAEYVTWFSASGQVLATGKLVSVSGQEIGRSISTQSTANMDPLEFEALVRDLLVRMGYQATLTKASHDGGIDIEAENPLPLARGKVIVQCKRYGSIVGASVVRDLYGTMIDAKAWKAILVTTSDFSADARRFAQDKPIELIDGHQLASVLAEHNSSADTRRSAQT